MAPQKGLVSSKLKKKEQYHHPNRTGTSGGGLNNFNYCQPRMPLSPRNGISREGLRTMTSPEYPPIKIGISHRGLRNLRIWPTQITTPRPNWNFLWRTLCGELCVEPVCAVVPKDTGSLQTLFNGRHLISSWNPELIYRTLHSISFHPYSVSTVSYPVLPLVFPKPPVWVVRQWMK